MTYLHPHRADADEVYQKYLDRAIAEINDLSGEIMADGLARHERLAAGSSRAVLGTGHPLASIFLLKDRPRAPEVDEGVAFYGRAGEAVLRSVRRLNIDPLDLYGTNVVKLGADGDLVDTGRDVQLLGWLRREIEIVSPRIIVAMGVEVVDWLNQLAGPDAARLTPVIGRQSWDGSTDVLVCPDIDDSLTSAANKRAFWEAFRDLGDWYASQPPY